MMQKQKLRIAVTGLSAGACHVADYAACSSVEELILCDVSEKKLEEVGEQYHIEKRYTDYTAMLNEEKPDAVSLAVPNYLHMPLAVQALEHGCHVLCEKPMARTAAEAGIMKDAASRSGKILMINFNQRFQPDCRALKKVIDNGLLGDIYYIRTLWHRQRGVPWWYPLAKGRETCGGGALIDLGVHVLDRALWFCGYPGAVQVMGAGFSHIAQKEAPAHGLEHFDLEDMGVAMIRLDSGAMLELEASWAANRENEEITTRIYGTRGGALLKDDRTVLFLEKDGGVEKVDLEPEEGPNIRQVFLDTILGRTAPVCTPEEGMEVSAILDAVYRSAETGFAVLL